MNSKKIISSSFLVILFFFSTWWGLTWFKSYFEPLYQFERIENNHGVFKEFYKNGRLKIYEEYFKGKRHGKFLFLSENGDTLEFFNYKEGKKHGAFSYYTQNGELVWMQVFSLDTLIQDTILNDSLYKYDFKAFETGMMTFEQSCASCHQTNEELMLFSDTIFSVANIDSIHVCLVDTLADTMAIKTYYQFDKNQLDAVKSYILDLKTQNQKKNLPNAIQRSLRKKIVRK
jgi:hypothetical protein